MEWYLHVKRKSQTMPCDDPDLLLQALTDAVGLNFISDLRASTLKGNLIPLSVLQKFHGEYSLQAWQRAAEYLTGTLCSWTSSADVLCRLSGVNESEQATIE